MVGTISSATQVTTACAVFKIDFKGRFVYIDDETEELFGLTREELFGKSIYDFISNDSHQILDTMLGHHNRYESFYESLPLTIRENDGQYRRLEAVITLNFIAGNPVNYQFILIPDRTAGAAPSVNWEHRLLELIQLPAEAVDLNLAAEMFCTVGGYAAAECYFSDDGRNLEIAGSYPHNDPGHSAPAYLEHFRHSNEHRFSFIPGDSLLHEGFGNRKSEAVLSLRFGEKRNIIVWMYGPAEYRPADTRIDDLRLYSNIWNSHYQPADPNLSAASQFSVMGQAGDALQFGVVVVNSDFEVVYSNSCFTRGLARPGTQEPENDFRKLYDSLEICDLHSQPMPFDQSPFMKSVRQGCFAIDCVKMAGQDRLLTLMTGPVKVAETQLYVYSFIPYHERAAEAYALNRSETKLIFSVAHDIRAPLIAIEAFARRLQTASLDQLDDDGRFAVDCIVENGQILQGMIDGLGEMSQNWAVRETPEKIAAKKFIEEVVTYLRATYPNSDYRIKLPDGLPDISAPKRKLTQLFRNILDNAFKYSAASDKPSIWVNYNLVDRWHQFTISDNGPGIEEEYRQKIFSPFFRAPEAASLPGTGMGLTIASDIVSSWGGKIQVDPSYKNGTRIVFTLPPQMTG